MDIEKENGREREKEKGEREGERRERKGVKGERGTEGEHNKNLPWT